MQKKLVFLLVFTVLIVVFALQNSVEMELKLWFWSIRTSMVLILILTFAAGAIAGILFSLPKKPGDKVKERISPAGNGADTVPPESAPPVNEDEYEDVSR